MEKIYLVISSRGTYEDYVESVECAFRSKEEAEKHCAEVDDSHNYEEVYEEEVWNDIMYELDEIIEKEAENYTNNVSYKESNEEWMKREEEIELLICNQLLSLLHKRGLTDATLEDVKKQREYEDHQYDEWHKCRIKEVYLY